MAYGITDVHGYTVLLNKLYEEYMGRDTSHPFSGALYNERDDPVVYSGYDLKLKLYSDFYIQKFFGYTFGEFLKLYPFEYGRLFKEAKRLMKNLDKTMENLDVNKELDDIT